MSTRTIGVEWSVTAGIAMTQVEKTEIVPSRARAATKTLVILELGVNLTLGFLVRVERLRAGTSSNGGRSSSTSSSDASSFSVVLQ